MSKRFAWGAIVVAGLFQGAAPWRRMPGRVAFGASARPSRRDGDRAIGAVDRHDRLRRRRRGRAPDVIAAQVLRSDRLEVKGR